MFGPEPLTKYRENQLGIVPRCCGEIFASLSSDRNVKRYNIEVSFFEIYIHNRIRDLLHPPKRHDSSLKVRDGRKGVWIEGLKSEPANNLNEILTLIAIANSHRTVSSTAMNKTSSRSHSIMEVIIRIERMDGSHSRSKLNFIDLAGMDTISYIIYIICIIHMKKVTFFFLNT